MLSAIIGSGFSRCGNSSSNLRIQSNENLFRLVLAGNKGKKWYFEGMRLDKNNENNPALIIGHAAIESNSEATSTTAAAKKVIQT